LGSNCRGGGGEPSAERFPLSGWDIFGKLTSELTKQAYKKQQIDMKKIRKSPLLFAIFLFLLGACQEFVHNSFDTFTGRVVDQEGKRFPGLELTVSQDIDFMNGQVPAAKSIVYRIKTDERGEFSFILPTRHPDAVDKYSYLSLTVPYRFQTEFNGEFVTENFLLASDAPRDADEVRDLGVLKIVRE